MMAIQQRYNIALLPENPVVTEELAAYAQTHLAPLAEEYLLGEDALAHVTLCQFYAADDATARAVFAGCTALHALTLVNHALCLAPVGGNYAGAFWCNLAVASTSELLAMQRACHAQVAELGGIPLTPPEGYVPHFTLASMREWPATLPPPTGGMLNQPMRMRPCLGRSSERGVFLARLAEAA